MPISEFELIKRYFHFPEPQRSDVALGIGDDCALLRPPAGQQLAVSTDTLVSGIHFFPDVDPQSLGHKSLAVNLSDLAAMGAQPAWVTLAISLPQAEESWLASFSYGFLQLAQRYQVQLVGGDTTRGPLSITVQVMGFVDPGRILRRDAACVGDAVYVTGSLGGAALALRLLQQPDVGEISAPLLASLLTPVPRVEFGVAATRYARCGIDISDGLMADLGHIAAASGVGIELQLETLPLAPLCDHSLALSGGDDYELCLTVSPGQCQNLETLAKEQGLQLTRIGGVITGAGVRCVDASGQCFDSETGGFDHFRTED